MTSVVLESVKLWLRLVASGLQLTFNPAQVAPQRTLSFQRSITLTFDSLLSGINKPRPALSRGTIVTHTDIWVSHFSNLRGE